VLRSLTTVPFMVRTFETLCRGNRFVTTIHAINSAILKLARLTNVSKVYRGIGGGILPEAFWKPDASGARGAVEFGFMSTTRDRSVAVGYAGAGAATVMEMQQGMIDRGADLSWLSQFPHEAEVCFAPLCALEVKRSRVDGATIVVDVRPSVNQGALTLGEVVAKMQRSHLQLVELLAADLRFAGAPARALSTLEAAGDAAAKREPEYFLVPANYKAATDAALDAQREAFDALRHPAVWQGASEAGVAARMRAVAELCVRAGAEDVAEELLRLANERAPLPAEQAAAVTAALGGRDVGGERWRLEAAAALIAAGAKPPVTLLRDSNSHCSDPAAPVHVRRLPSPCGSED
jgi:hypothetical protein